MKTPKRYYYEYLESFIRFLTPHGKTSYKIVGKEEAHALHEGKGSFDYVIAIDALGYVHDIGSFLESMKTLIHPEGRLILTQYNALWEPILRFASWIGLRRPNSEQNWIALSDIKNISVLAGLEVIKTGSKMIFPLYIPFISTFLNVYIAHLWPFSRLGIFHYVVLRQNKLCVCGVEATKEKQPSLSIIIPARNEAGTIEKMARELPLLGSSTELIFIEGNSTDTTFDEIKRVAEIYGKTRKIRFAQQEGKGKGDAVRKGFDMATGDIVAIYDADMTVPPEEVEKFYNLVASGIADFANGSRLVYPMEKESMRVLNLMGNKFFSLAFSWLLDQTLKDTLCGTKVLWKKDYEEIQKNRSYFGEFDPFGDFDLLFGAAKLNLKILDVPVHYRDRIYGETNIKRWSHGWLLLKMTVFAARKIKFI